MIHYVLEIVNRRIQFAFVEMPACEIAVELRKVLLGVVVSRNFLALVAFEVLGTPKIVLSPIDCRPGVSHLCQKPGHASHCQCANCH
jgi:hypothetical protein